MILEVNKLTQINHEARRKMGGGKNPGELSCL